MKELEEVKYSLACITGTVATLDRKSVEALVAVVEAAMVYQAAYSPTDWSMEEDAAGRAIIEAIRGLKETT